MAGYYYLGAQLPLLFFERPPLITLEAFLEEARKWLRGTDRKALELATIEPTRSSPGLLPAVLGRYLEFERDLRTDLEAWRRAVRAGQEYKPVHFPLALVKEGDPLEVEKKLLRRRWDFLSELEVGHVFDLEFVLVYSLKLRILGRLLLFEKEKGVRVFQELCEVSV